MSTESFQNLKGAATYGGLLCQAFMRNVNSPLPIRNCGLHPLIHTIAPETSAQDVEKKKAEPKTQHFFSSNQDIVPWS